MNVGIALGSNLGDRYQNIETGFARLRDLSINSKILRSSLFETSPVDCPPDSANFLNAAAEINYVGTPRELLNELLKIEKELGRDRSGIRNEPRSLDLDILYFGDLMIDEEDLIIPHPRMTQRRFVLEPLAEIQPDLILSGKKQSISELLKKLL